MGGIILVVLFMVGFGVLSLAAPDLLWSWTQWNNELKGVKSERTDAWEMSRTFSGVVLIVVGLGFGLWSCGITSQRASEEAERTAVAENRIATQSAEITSFDEAFEAAIPQLLEMATEDMQTVRAYRLGVDTETYTTIDYGRCKDSGDFYMYVFNYKNDWQTYAYGIGEELCQHPDRRFLTPRDLGEGAHGGVWYTVPGFSKAMPTEEAMTPIPATPARTPEATEE